MNDYWNDPPDDCEPPECCGEFMDFNENTGACTCAKCGKIIEPQKDPEYDELFIDELFMDHFFQIEEKP